MDTSDRRYLWWGIPLLLSLPLTIVPVPSWYLYSRELGHYYQSVALLNQPIDSFTVLTFRESGAGVHLYSALVSPLLPLFGPASGRIVSLLLCFLASITLGILAQRLFDTRTALLAPILLWAHPFYYRFTWTWSPEGVSFLSTIGAVYAAVRAVDENSRRWLLLTYLAVALGVANHTWEATIALPLLVWFAYHRRWRSVILVPIITVASVAMVRFLIVQQPWPTVLSGYAVTETGLGIYFTKSFWLRFVTFPYSPFYAGHGSLTISAAIAAGYWVYRDGVPTRNRLLMVSWIASGTAIPLLLPGGLNHYYYLWGLVAPVVLTAAVIAEQGIRFFAERPDSQTAIRRGVIAVLLVFILLNGMVFELGLLTGGPGTAPSRIDTVDRPTVQQSSVEDVAKRINERGIESSRQVVFVTATPDRYRSVIFRVLVASGVDMPGWQAGMNPSPPVRVESSLHGSTDCQAKVIFEDNSVRLHDCDRGY